MRAILIGCVAGKVAHAAPARELYTTALFRRRREYAERAVAAGRAHTWMILSAKHGLVAPETVLHPYDEQLVRARVSDLSFKLRPQLGKFKAGDVLEIHAGAHYVDAVTRTTRFLATFKDLPLHIDAPMAGLRIGEQLRWYLNELYQREGSAA